MPRTKAWVWVRPKSKPSSTIRLAYCSWAARSRLRVAVIVMITFLSCGADNRRDDGLAPGQQAALTGVNGLAGNSQGAADLAGCLVVPVEPHEKGAVIGRQRAQEHCNVQVEDLVIDGGQVRLFEIRG